jgi:hypothetical protein
MENLSLRFRATFPCENTRVQVFSFAVGLPSNQTDNDISCPSIDLRRWSLLSLSDTPRVCESVPKAKDSDECRLADFHGGWFTRTGASNRGSEVAPRQCIDAMSLRPKVVACSISGFGSTPIVISIVLHRTRCRAKGETPTAAPHSSLPAFGSRTPLVKHSTRC